MSPNSFFNAQQDLSSALQNVEAMINAGVAIIDVGGEATNPSVNIERDAPSISQEIRRVTPVIQAIKKRFDIVVSVDTSQPDVMRAAVEAGADIINDQRALKLEGALDAVLELNTPVCLMHFFQSPREPGVASLPQFFHQVKTELTAAVGRCLAAGMTRDKIIIDPGFGQGNFSKNCEENFYLLSRLPELNALGYPVLSGWSRKSMIGDVLGVPVDKRLHGSVASATISAMLGAAIIRAHDVRETVDAIKITRQVLSHHH